jgi:hypothetical protein
MQIENFDHNIAHGLIAQSPTKEGTLSKPTVAGAWPREYHSLRTYSTIFSHLLPHFFK